MAKTKIEYCDWTINPLSIVGGGYYCTKCSSGCKNCYAEKQNYRFYKNKFAADCSAEKNVEWELNLAAFDKLPKRKPQIVFVQSMSDMFHSTVPAEMQESIFVYADMMPHTFIFITKRPDNMKKAIERFARSGAVKDNFWLAATVCEQSEISKLDELISLDVPVKIANIEPMLGHINLRSHLPYLDGVFCGAETGSGARLCSERWVIELQQQCELYDVPFFFKKFADGRRTVDGRMYEQLPGGGVEYPISNTEYPMFK